MTRLAPFLDSYGLTAIPPDWQQGWPVVQEIEVYDGHLGCRKFLDLIAAGTKAIEIHTANHLVLWRLEPKNGLLVRVARGWLGYYILAQMSFDDFMNAYAAHEERTAWDRLGAIAEEFGYSDHTEPVARAFVGIP